MVEGSLCDIKYKSLSLIYNQPGESGYKANNSLMR